MDYNLKSILLARLAALQEDCSPITLRLGSVTESGGVDNNEIVITHSPAAIWSCLYKFKEYAKAEEGTEVYIQAGRGGIRIW